jgi:hypothetical protein
LYRRFWHIDDAVEVAIGVTGNIDRFFIFCGLGIIDEKISHQARTHSWAASVLN